MELPFSPKNPYLPHVLSCERDLDFSEDFTEVEKANLRKANGIVSCVGVASTIYSEEIMYLIEYYNLEGKWLRPRSFMRMYIFDTVGLPTPRLLLTKKLVELGLGHQCTTFFIKLSIFMI